MPLDDLRKKIDDLDDAILAILEQRTHVVDDIAAEKRRVGAASFHDPERERKLLDRVAAKGAGRFPREAIRAVFREIMSGCLSLEQPMKVAFLGPEGTFSHMAARHLFGLAARYREATTIEGVFDSVRRGHSDCGVVPIENSTEGAVTFTLDALLEGDVAIRQELVLGISHCLLGRATDLADVARVYSHPQALAQCRGWLGKFLPGAELVQTPSTSAAAREAQADDAAAAIASRLAGELYGLPVLRERIQDRVENATRFVVIGKGDAPRTGDDKTTLAFSVRDEAGALKRVLELFDAHGINLSRIESRPSQKRQWEYVFTTDLRGHRDDPNVAAALAELEARCATVQVLGSYAACRHVVAG